MKLDTMIQRLMDMRKLYGNIEVAILDDFNGGGEPRTINCGPLVEDVNKLEELDDINTREGMIVLMGYGCY